MGWARKPSSKFVEDIEDYRAFEAAVIANYDAQTAVERELVLRLVSLLWRLRRATSIETDLLRIQAEILRERRDQTQRQPELRVIETNCHRAGKEVDWWSRAGAEPLESARSLCTMTHPTGALG
jgi:hypothetical protein